VISAEKTKARRTAAIVLAFVCGGQAIEGLHFLWLTGEAAATEGLPAAALLLVRTALLASTALVSALLLRASSRSR
jgi:hypothetical protein